jgi:hypothetical protein
MPNWAQVNINYYFLCICFVYVGRTFIDGTDTKGVVCTTINRSHFLLLYLSHIKMINCFSQQQHSTGKTTT